MEPDDEKSYSKHSLTKSEEDLGICIVLYYRVFIDIKSTGMHVSTYNTIYIFMCVCVFCACINVLCIDIYVFMDVCLGQSSLTSARFRFRPPPPPQYCQQCRLSNAICQCHF